MEVLQDSPWGRGHFRRRRDSFDESDRRLDWSVRKTDILLAPRSPCSLEQTLGHQGQRIELLPELEPLADDNLDPPVLQASQLLTCHPQGELQELCRRVLVENALVKRRGQRQLILAAGFVELPAADPAMHRRRAPLLLYPVILTRRAQRNPDHGDAPPDDAAPRKPPVYELRMDCDAPEINTVLVDQCSALFTIDLPVLAENESLNVYFSRIAQALGSTGELHLSLDMALGSRTVGVAVDEANTIPGLPDRPAGFDLALARLIIDQPSLDDVDLLLDLLDDGSLLPDADNGSGVDCDPATAGADSLANRNRLHELSLQLVEHEIGHIEFKRLPSLPRDLQRWSASVQACLQSRLIADILRAPRITGRQLVRLAGIIELLDRAPDRLTDFAHPDLCFRATPGLLQRARHQARLIEEEMKASEVWFNLDKTPPRQRLMQLMDELEGAIGRDPELVDATYFSARRQFMEFCVDKPTQLGAEHLERLRELVKLLRFRELFINNAEYRLALGPGYRGLHTDWSALAKSVGYAREMAESMGSESLAGRALTDWSGFRQAFMSDLATLQRAADHLRKLLWALGTHWQVEVAERLVTQAQETRVPLATMLDEFHDVASRAADTSTPPMAATSAEVLALLGRPGGSLAESSHLAAGYRAELKQRLHQGELSADGLVATLGWLQAVSQQLRERTTDDTNHQLARLASSLQTPHSS